MTDFTPSLPAAHPSRGAPRRRLARALALGLALTLTGCQSASVLSPAGLRSPATAAPVLGFAEVRGSSALVIDAINGRVLYDDEAEALRYPASLTKLMTLLLAFEAVEAGRLSLDEPMAVSAEAASRPPAKIGVRAGSTITAGEAIRALAVRSANDVAVVLAERLAGSEAAFTAAMNARARSLGLASTRFANASGLPDPAAVTSARDVATLARIVRTRFPGYAPAFAAREFFYEGRRFEATNKLLGKVAGVDGLKTGYTRDSGFHLVATATLNGRSVIVVVLGGATGAERDSRVTALLADYL